MAKQAFKKGRRSCCFCEGHDLDKEHFWPKWAHALLPDGDTHTRSKTAGRQREVKGVLSRQGAPKVISLRRTCRRCNNEWMSQMEMAVRPYLQPILERRAVELPAVGQELLAQYFVMKSMVADLSRDGENVYSVRDRTDFYRDRSIPPGTMVSLYLFQHETDPFVGQYNKEATGNDGSDWETSKDRECVANFIFRFGELLVQILLTRNPNADVRGAPGWTYRIHPPTSALLRWPPLLRLSARDAYRVQHSLEGLGRYLEENGL
ncbi:hypothetical protein [Sphingobium sp. CR28]|uniref:hypothetical protein n=1 Tax=Sphingobium sp. CR28 TaxID=3400272 RepID=UPI003FEE4E86